MRTVGDAGWAGEEEEEKGDEDVPVGSHWLCFAFASGSRVNPPSGHPRLQNHGLKNKLLKNMIFFFLLKYIRLSSVAPAAWVLWVPNVPCQL